jgi:hypothetical protein
MGHPLHPKTAVSPSLMYPWPPRGSLPSTAYFSARTRPQPATLLPIGSGYFSSQTFSHINNPQSQPLMHFIPTRLWRLNRQSVPKGWNLNYRHQWITQQKADNKQLLVEHDLSQKYQITFK